MLPKRQRFELVVLEAVPALLTLFLAMFYIAPKHVEGLRMIMPILPLFPIYFWGMLHTRAIPYWFMFAVGLMMDSVSGAPLGMTSLIYMFFLVAIHLQRKILHKEGFMARWGYFSLLVGVVMGLNIAGLSWAHIKTLPVLPMLAQWFLTSACYPLAHQVCDLIEQYLNDRRWKILHGR